MMSVVDVKTSLQLSMTSLIRHLINDLEEMKKKEEDLEKENKFITESLEFTHSTTQSLTDQVNIQAQTIVALQGVKSLNKKAGEEKQGAITIRIFQDLFQDSCRFSRLQMHKLVYQHILFTFVTTLFLWHLIFTWIGDFQDFQGPAKNMTHFSELTFQDFLSSGPILNL